MPTLNLPRMSGEQTSEDANSEEDVILVGESVPNKKCGVVNCKSQTKIMFDFPSYQNDNKMYLEWVSFCDNDKLKNMQPEELNKSYGICDVHFKDGIMAFAGVTPMIQAPSNGLQTTDEIYVASRLCRLCFDVGGVDMFSCRYHNKLLKDIVKMFIPIQIKEEDVSKLICEACKSAIMKFYDFQERSLEVNKFFESISNEVTNNTDEIMSQETDDVPVVEITDDEDPEAI
ncbi:zinc-finger associated domain containing protein, partial [Oryctes borbonicus]